MRLPRPGDGARPDGVRPEGDRADGARAAVARRVRARTDVRVAVTDAPAGPAEHRVLALVLLGSGAMHLLRPQVFDPLVPPWLPPSRRFWTVASGLAELGVGLAVSQPRTRRAGGFAAAGLFVAVFPGNLWMAWRWRGKALPYRVGAVARLPLQVPLVAWGLRVARSAAPGR